MYSGVGQKWFPSSFNRWIWDGIAGDARNSYPAKARGWATCDNLVNFYVDGGPFIMVVIV